MEKGGEAAKGKDGYSSCALRPLRLGGIAQGMMGYWCCAEGDVDFKVIASFVAVPL
jgi:hypothetical protein